MSFKNFESFKKKSSKESLFSIFQLIENNKNLENSTHSNEFCTEDLLKECLQYISSVNIDESPVNKIYLKKIQLKDFRKFREVEVSFDENLTVLIGCNGVGKSSIIDAVTKTISWIGNGLLKENDNGRPITYDDINNKSENYAEINSFFEYGNTHFSGNISKAIKGRSTKKDSHVYNLKQFSNIIRNINHYQEINLPLFCYYPVERLRDTLKNSINKQSENINKYNAYKDAWDGKLKIDDFFDIFSIINNKSELEEGSEKIETLRNKIDSLKSLNSYDQDILNILEKSLNELVLKNKFSSFEAKSNINFKKIIETIKKALISKLLGINEISFNSFSGKSQVYFHLADGNIVSSKQLSHGQKVIFSLIGDICLRLLLLNPKLNNPLYGQGIILIDELELHLHPSWQQKILLFLITTFPNIQFIVSTHSPQILSTIHKKHIRQLNENGIIIEPEYQTEGSRSSDILEQLMFTLSIPQIEIDDSFNYYLSLVEQNLHETSEAIELEKKLISHYGENHSKISEMKSLVRLNKLKNKIMNIKKD